MRDTGATISPFHSFLFLQGLETLSLRMDRHNANAMAVAQFLTKRPEVQWVRYPGLPGDSYHERAKRYFPKGAGGILSFGIRGGLAAGKRFIDALEIFSLLANVSDAKSLVIHPASTTHSQLDEEGLRLTGVAPEGIRLSVGLEDINDLIEDLEQALRKAAGSHD